MKSRTPMLMRAGRGVRGAAMRGGGGGGAPRRLKRKWKRGGLQGKGGVGVRERQRGGSLQQRGGTKFEGLGGGMGEEQEEGARLAVVL